MKIALFGSSGFIGQSLVSYLPGRGHSVTRVKRGAPSSPTSSTDSVYFEPGKQLPPGLLSGFDAVINLCGANLASSRWSESRKQVLRDSRIIVTRQISESLAGSDRKPAVFINASATGYYGNVPGNYPLDESCAAGEGFLAELCRNWEEAARPVSGVGIRVVHARIGLVLGRGGGALGKMLPAFKLGAGPVLGSGRQRVSWIALADLSTAFGHILDDESISGPVNMVAPNPLSNLEFTRALNGVLGKPTWLRAPAWLLELLLGQMATETVLASQQAIPGKLTESGFEFRYPNIESALAYVLAR